MKKMKEKIKTFAQIYEEAINKNEESLNSIFNTVRVIVYDYLSFFNISDADKKLFLEDINKFTINFIAEASIRKDDLMNATEFMNALSETIIELGKELEKIGVITKIKIKQ